MTTSVASVSIAAMIQSVSTALATSAEWRHSSRGSPIAAPTSLLPGPAEGVDEASGQHRIIAVLAPDLDPLIDSTYPDEPSPAAVANDLPRTFAIEYDGWVVGAIQCDEEDDPMHPEATRVQV